MLETTPSSAKVAISASETISRCSRRCRAARMRGTPRSCGRSAQPSDAAPPRRRRCNESQPGVRPGCRRSHGRRSAVRTDSEHHNCLGIGIGLTQARRYASRSRHRRTDRQPVPRPRAWRAHSMVGSVASSPQYVVTPTPSVCRDLTNSGQVLDRPEVGPPSSCTAATPCAAAVRNALRAADRRS